MDMTHEDIVKAVLLVQDWCKCERHEVINQWSIITAVKEHEVDEVHALRTRIRDGLLSEKEKQKREVKRMREEVRARGQGEVDINVDEVQSEADIGRNAETPDPLGLKPILMQSAAIGEAKLRNLFKPRD